MTAQQTHVAPTAIEAVESAVEFRVSRSGMPRRRLRLVGPRYVFGSGPDCSIRLDDPSVRTTHAVLTHEADVVLLRAYGAPIPVNGHSATEAALELGDHFQLGQYDFELIATSPPQDTPAPADAWRESSAGSAEPTASAVAPAASSIPEEAPPEGATSDAGGTQGGEAPDRRHRVAFADSMRIVRESATAGEAFAGGRHGTGRAIATARPAAARSATQEMIDHLALLADERRRQERSKRQIARYRRREEQQRKQIQSLRAAQDAAEQRARRAEESVHEVRGQLDALADRVTVLAKTAMPDIEDRLHQQHQESLVATRQYNELIEALRQRLDAVQDAVDVVQGETREIRQETASVREDQQEVLSNAEQLEQMIQLLTESRDAERAGQASELDEMRETLRQLSLKLAHTSSQLDETRQSSQGLSTLVQQLRASLLNMQTDSQRFATIERIDTVERQLRVTDVRLNELCQEYDAQTVQLQQECETLRQRLDDVEDSAAQFSRSVSIPADAPLADTPLADTPLADAPLADTPLADAPPAIDETSQDAPEQSSLSEAMGDDLPPPQWQANRSEVADEDVEWGSTATLRDMETDQPVPSLGVATSEESVAPAEEAAGDEPTAQDRTDAEEASTGWSVPPEEAESEDAESEWSASLAADHREVSPWEVADRDPAGDEPQDEDESITYGRTQPFDPAEHAFAPEQDIAPQQLFAPEQDLAPEPTFGSEPSFGSERAFAPEESFDAEQNGGAEQQLESEQEFNPEQTFRMDSMAEGDWERDGASESEEAFGATMPLGLGATERVGEGDVSDAQENSPPSTPPAPTGGRSAAEILASMGLACEDDEESADATQLGTHWSTPEESPEATRESGSAGAASSDSSDEEEADDDSIEAYMNRLLKRVQGGTVPGPASCHAPAESKPTTHTVEPTSRTDSDAAETAASNATEEQRVLESAPYVPRSQAPERTSGFGAMRELANSSARLAIAHSVRQRMVHEKMFKFALFAMGLVAGFAALIGSGFQMDRWFIVACCCFGLSIFFLIEGLSLARRLRQVDAAPTPTLAD